MCVIFSECVRVASIARSLVIRNCRQRQVGDLRSAHGVELAGRQGGGVTFLERHMGDDTSYWCGKQSQH
jgi:hypothetical protein